MLLAQGDALTRAHQRTAAEATYRQGALLCPESPAPHLRLAHLYLDWNRPQEGLEAIAKAERAGAAPAETAALRAALLAAQGNWEEALRWGERARAMGNTDPALLHLLGDGYLRMGQVDRAAEAYRALLAIAPDDRRTQERLGVLTALSDPAAAADSLRAASTPLAEAVLRALESSGPEPAARLMAVGQACLKAGEPALAAVALERAVLRAPDFAEARALLGYALTQLASTPEEHQRAREHLEAAVRLQPNSPLARSLLGLYLLRRGDPAGARPHLEAAYDLDPTNPAVALHLGLTYADLGDYLVADVWLSEATRLAPKDPKIWEAVARFYTDRFGRDPRGAAAAQALVRLAPDDAGAHDLLGWALFRAGKIAEAEESLRKALTLDPNLASAHYHLGVLRASLGQHEQAQEALRRALDLNTDPQMREEIEEALAVLSPTESR
ncbi:MAG: tetratricopeptide repeat protein [Anaerolineae bacterium]|nr:tetratricopeptide repeat protein [Anaerolineae bacterium]